MKELSLFAEVFGTISIAFAGVIVSQVKDNRTNWSYKGKTGPENWWKLNPDYSLCKDGKSQSPIDIDKVYKTKLYEIKFSYKDTPIKLINTGMTIQEDYKKGSSALINGEKFNLIQYHFHTPSEHTIKGRRYAMEMHLVHKNTKGQIAVIGVLFKVGKFNKSLQKLIDNLPKSINKYAVDDKIKTNAINLLPNDRKYYHYFGSLTTPPCTEGVSWNIFITPVEASQAQINKFKSAMGENARPVQPLNNRFVLESN